MESSISKTKELFHKAILREAVYSTGRSKILHIFQKQLTRQQQHLTASCSHFAVILAVFDILKS